ncbi:MAG: WYL domain-containing protein [Lachnospiraceae bacterium]|nr:WYL domain-containing protein [Lachnospiraceae bacterium]MBR5066686.1 WYL domain-containing protein [Lachnospiraceae bacterium]
MAKGNNQKFKLIYLIKILERLTDEDHSLTMSQIISELESNDISAERKSVYSDLEALRELGYDVIGDDSGRYYGYFLGERTFELAELKLLVDSVSASKFITDKKSKALIKKLESLTSAYNAGKLERQVVVGDRVKTMNESIYINVDMIHSAIAENSQIRFRYFNYNPKKEIEYKRDGEFYYVSPWALIWNDENYYLVAYDSLDEKIKHFRVDKMNKMSLVEARREGASEFKKINISEYSGRVFGMYSGRTERVKMEFDNELSGVVIDKFGKDVNIVKTGAKKFLVIENVNVSKQFFGWIFGLGEGAKIIGPQSVVDEMNLEMMKRLGLEKK